MGFGSILAQGIAGAVAGAGQGAAEQALLEQKNEMQRLRDERLAQLKMQQFRQQLGIKTEAAHAEEERQQKQVGGFFANAPKGTTTTTDAQDAAESGGTMTEGQTTTTPLSDMDAATQTYQAALKTGNKAIIDEARNRLKDVEGVEDKKTHRAQEDQRISLDARRTAADEARADAYIKKTLAPDGKEADPAKVREVKWLADNVFKGDVKKATDLAYGIREEPRERAIARWAAILKNDLTSPQEDVVKRATEIVDTFRKGEAGAKTGVVDQNRASGATKRSGDVATPTSKAEYDALPSGALWVDPRDGKTYRKP